MAGSAHCKVQLNLYKSQCTIAERQVNELLAKDIHLHQDLPEYLMLHDKLKNLCDQVYKLHLQFLTSLSEEKFFEQDLDGSLWEKKVTEMDEFVTPKLKLVYKMEEIISIMKSTSLSGDEQVTSESNKQSTSQQVKLPQITLPAFEGDHSKWYEFWDSFKASVASRAEIRPVDKLSYLKSCLKGSPLELVSGFQLTDANYQCVVELLESTYANPKKIKWDLILKLNDIKCQSGSLADLTTFRSNIEQCVRALEGLGIDIGTSGTFITPVLFNRLPFKVKEQVQYRCGEDYPNLEQLRDSLGKVITNLSSLNVKPSQEKQKPKMVSESKRGDQPYPEQAIHKSDIGNFNILINDFDNVQRKACAFCHNTSHKSANCTVHKSVEDRIKRLKANKRCLKCTSATHYSVNCRVRFSKCDICKLGHHNALCKKKSLLRDKTHITNLQVSVSGSQNDCLSSHALPTAMLKVIHCDSISNVRALFDQGAQRSFVSKGLITQLGLKTFAKVRSRINGFNTSKQAQSYDVIRLQVLVGNEVIAVEALAVDNIPSTVKVAGVGRVVENLKEANIALADPMISGDQISDIGLLIGVDHYFKFIDADKKLPEISVSLIKSKVGYMLAGPVGNAGKVIDCHSIHVMSLGVNTSDIAEVEDTNSNEVKVKKSIQNAKDMESYRVPKIDKTSNCEGTFYNFNANMKDGLYEVAPVLGSDLFVLPYRNAAAKCQLNPPVDKFRSRAENLKSQEEICELQDMNFICKVPPGQLSNRLFLKSSTTASLPQVDPSARAHEGLQPFAIPSEDRSQKQDPTCQNIDVEVGEGPQMTRLSIEKESVADLSRFSKLEKVIRVTKLVFKFIGILKSRIGKGNSNHKIHQKQMSSGIIKIHCDEFVTLVTDILCQLNGRTFTEVGDLLKDLEPLTQLHLLYGRCHNSIPIEIHKDYKLDSSDNIFLPSCNNSIKINEKVTRTKRATKIKSQGFIESLQIAGDL